MCEATMETLYGFEFLCNIPPIWTQKMHSIINYLNIF